MARQLVVFALVFVAIISMAMAQQAPSSSPKSSPSPKASPSPKSSPSPSPPSSSSESPLSSPPAPTPSGGSDESASDQSPSPSPINFDETEANEAFSPDEGYSAADETSGVTARQVSVAVTVAAVAGFLAF